LAAWSSTLAPVSLSAFFQNFRTNFIYYRNAAPIVKEKNPVKTDFNQILL
jgi:hypothetical protein